MFIKDIWCVISVNDHYDYNANQNVLDKPHRLPKISHDR